MRRIDTIARVVGQAFTAGLVALTGLAVSASADPVYLVDTGPGANTGGRSLSATQFLAAQFTLDAASELAALEGWMIYPTVIGDLPVEVVLYADDAGLPDVGQELHRQLFTVPASGIPFSSDWHGVSGLALEVDSGTYWLAFEVPTADFGSGAMPPTPVQELDGYAIDSGAGWLEAGGNSADWIGIRVLPEPEIGASLWPALIGLAGWRRIRTRAVRAAPPERSTQQAMLLRSFEPGGPAVGFRVTPGGP